MSTGVNVAGIIVHFADAVKLLGVSRVMLDSALTFVDVYCLHLLKKINNEWYTV